MMIKSLKIICVYHVARRRSTQAFGGKTYRRGPHGRPRHRYEIILKCYLEIGQENKDWICVAQYMDHWQVGLNIGLYK